MASSIGLTRQALDVMRQKIADNREAGEIRWRWFDSDLESLLDYVDALLIEVCADCVCDGGPQGEGCVSIPHEPQCPLFEKA